MSVYEELMKEGTRGKRRDSSGRPPKRIPLTPEERAQYEAAQKRAAARKIPYPKGSAGETGEPTQSTRSDASTEHEGPSLREKLEKLREIAPFLAGAARGLAAVASRAAPVVARATGGASTAAGGAATRTAAATPSLASKVHRGVQTGRKVVQGVRLAQDVKQAIDRRRQSREAERDVAHTEHEGPSLREKLTYLKIKI